MAFGDFWGKFSPIKTNGRECLPSSNLVYPCRAQQQEDTVMLAEGYSSLKERGEILSTS